MTYFQPWSVKTLRSILSLFLTLSLWIPRGPHGAYLLNPLLSLLSSTSGERCVWQVFSARICVSSGILGSWITSCWMYMVGRETYSPRFPEQLTSASFHLKLIRWTWWASPEVSRAAPHVIFNCSSEFSQGYIGASWSLTEYLMITHPKLCSISLVICPSILEWSISDCVLPNKACVCRKALPIMLHYLNPLNSFQCGFLFRMAFFALGNRAIVFSSSLVHLNCLWPNPLTSPESLCLL